jgi:GTP-binding protein YchF
VGEKEVKAQLALVDKALELVRAGKPARLARIGPEEERGWWQLQLLTAKPVLYVCNVDEASIGGNELTAKVKARAEAEGAGCVVISAKIEAELAGLEPEERAYYLEHLGLKEPGLNAMIREGYRLLDLITFFTAGPKEARAWTVPDGTRAPRAAGAIHTDFEKGFIRAETIAYADFVALGGEAGAKEAGTMRLEGKDYVVRDGDVMHFRFAT